ncbi:MAG: hypothetical protein K1Y02_10525 [Candidatus Hydrogenedentes bacterium]|nr:hypothetical protein [Candidatus Hydrogenedentota bacterium]
MKPLWALLVCLAVCSCASSGGSVIEKVKYDFGIGEKPEGYVSGTDKVMERLDGIGKSELKRMNMAGRHGEVVFEGEGQLRGKYYKKVKVYEEYHPLDAFPTSRSSATERGFIGLIQYTYRVYEGERKSNRTEAAAASANTQTDVSGRETYRYRFGQGATWDGAPGELTRD